jgi:hypothetical protein
LHLCEEGLSITFGTAPFKALPSGKGIEVHWNKWQRIKIPIIPVNQVK